MHSVFKRGPSNFMIIEKRSIRNIVKHFLFLQVYFVKHDKNVYFQLLDFCFETKSNVRKSCDTLAPKIFLAI